MESTGGEPELRRCPRFPARGWVAWVEWRDGARGCGAGAELINISLAGALILLPGPPGVGHAVTLRIDGIRPRVWLPATVMAVREGLLGHQVHLEFRTPCPAPILDAVIGDRGP